MTGPQPVPVDRLADVDVVLSYPVGGGPRVELVDRRNLAELVSLDPRSAATLAGRIAAASVEAGQRTGHDSAE